MIAETGAKGRNDVAKILIVAEHASAQFGGEALIPYQYFKCLREIGADVHMLVHARTRDELQKAFPNDVDRLHFVSDSLLNKCCAKIGQYMPNRLAVFTVGTLSHFETQIRQRRIARFLIHSQHFNLVHEPIPVSPKLPSMMFGLSVPVIIGPMNGGMDYPPNYDVTSRFERVTVAFMRWSAGLWNKLIPGKLNAALILVANQRTYNALPSNIQPKIMLEFAENGVDTDRFSQKENTRIRDALNIIYVGRLVDWKRVDLLLKAGSELIGKLNFKIHVVGDGVLRGHLEDQVKDLSLTHHVRFHGWLPQFETAKLLRNADIMVLPSMRECGGAVVLEAMASGLPVIAVNWGGPADYIATDAGILIPPDSPNKFVSELANSIMWMAVNPDLRSKMGTAGRNRAQRVYDWRVKAGILAKIYQAVVNCSNTDLEALKMTLDALKI